VTQDLTARLQLGLGHVYLIERELGGGGMSRVYTATETALDRIIVLKVLPPELGQALSTDRFRQEIRLAARLQHLHIVPLLSAGEADGLLYYTMPFVEGESLRTRLARGGELPVREAVKLLTEVAEALAYAHGHGVVHRDVKPDNVLLSGGHAQVADFGVAKALSAAATTESSGLTSLGVALGTPAYMAPEQAAADPHVDHRADLYAWGCLAYECLTGNPPFIGRPTSALLAAHVSEAPEPIGRRRPGLPPGLAALVMRCLEKRPADRPQSAAEVLQALEGVITPSGGTAPTLPLAALQRRRWIRPAIVLAVTALVMGAAAVLWQRSTRVASGPLDPQRVAVLPFRVSGADPSLTYLREGMVDLLAAKLTGQGGPRAVDPRAAMRSWRVEGKGMDDLDEAAARRTAARLGAGQFLVGSVVGSHSHVVLSAQLLPSSGSGAGTQATVEGPGDSLPMLLDRLVGRLLALGAGQGDQRLASLTTTSLPALRAYLDGLGQYRRGQYPEAAIRLEEAVQLDSGFVLAAFALVQTGVWSGYVNQARAEDLAWKLRDRLSPRDRIMLEAFLGPRGPRTSSGAELLAARVRAVETVPEQADAWYYLGDLYFHFGAQLGIPDAHERSATAFRRSLALDSTFAGPLFHLVTLLAERGDTAGVRQRGALYLRVDSTTEGALYTRWRIAQALRDPTLLADTRAKIDSSKGGDLAGVAFWPWDAGLDLGDTDRAIEAMRRDAATPGDRSLVYYAQSVLELNRGRPRRAFAALDSTVSDPTDLADAQIVFALLWDADTAIGAAAARRLAPLTEAPPAKSAKLRRGQYERLYWIEAWRLAHGDTRSAERTIARLRAAAVPGDSAATVEVNAIRATLLSAWLAVVKGVDATARLGAADSLVRSVPTYLMSTTDLPENLILARLFVALGDNRRALAAVRRRLYGLSDQGMYLSSYLREEGRLAALTGDRQGAIRAYSRYLALRTDPEPELRERVNEVKAELAKLVGEQASR
jgi:eukaryotic-like serine/threonine-protein kinase